jgi:hypothetical protein
MGLNGQRGVPYSRVISPCGLAPSRAAERPGSTTPQQPVWQVWVLPPGAMEVVVTDRWVVALTTTWLAWRYHVDLCQTSAALCPA